MVRLILLFMSFYLIINITNCKTDSKTDNGKRDEIRELLPDIKEIGKSIDNNGIKSGLWLVGTYLAAHKYFGVDFRYLTGNIGPSDQVFYKKFPSPTLRDLDKGVALACESSALECIEEILPNARLSGSLQHIMKTEEELTTFAPFENNFEDFKYRQTAMYFLCWHTQLQDSFLEFNEGEQSCLSHLNAVDEIPEKIRYKLIKDETPAINDIRDANFKEDVFTCAHLWFCPDPCYGRKDRGNFVKTNFKVKGNPCLDLKNSECKWKKGENINFHDLIRNRFNSTCDCNSYHVGFEWNSRFGLCVDIDECFNRKADCQDTRICKNAMGSYICACPRGYDVNPSTDTCEKMSALHQSATLLEFKYFETDVNREEKEDFIMSLMEFVGISASIRLHASSSLILPFTILLNRIVY